MRISPTANIMLCCLFLVAAGCGSSPEDKKDDPVALEDDAKIPVMVSIVPQAYFVQRVGGESVTVESIAPPNYSPETYQITPRQMDALGQTRVYFRIGMPFEEELAKRLSATFPSLRIVDTREGVPLLEMCEDGGHEGHDHDHHGHVHGEHDPHIWLDPTRVKIQARTIAAALQAVRPEKAEEFAGNLVAFERDLDALHGQVSEILAPVRGRVIYVFHPAFGYFADAFGLEQRAIEFEGKSPGPRRLQKIVDEIRNSSTRAIFEQPQFKAAELQAVAKEANVEVVLLDGLAADWGENLKQMASVIVEKLQ